MEKKVKRLSWLLMVVVLMAAVTACGGGSSNTASGDAEVSGSAGGSKSFKVALLTPGPVNDNGWNANAYNGLLKIKDELKATVQYSEKVAASDMNEFIRGYADDGFNVIIGHGFEFGDVMLEVAKDYPDTWFLVTSSTVSQSPNVASISINNKEQGYLMGTVAALISSSGTVASIGGSDIPPITNSVKGFKQGAEAAVPGIKVLSSMLGTNDDITKAKETAISFIEQGADVVMTNANAAGSGGIEAAKQSGVLAIGSNQDQNPSAPDTVVTSVIQDYPQAIAVTVKRIMDGELKPEAQLLGVKDGAVYLSPYHSFDSKIPQEKKEKIEAAVQALKDGTIVVNNE